MLVTEIGSTMDDNQPSEGPPEKRAEPSCVKHWGKIHKHHGRHHGHGTRRQGYTLRHSPCPEQTQDIFHGKHHRGHRHGPRDGPDHGPRHGPHDGPHHGPHHGPRHGPHDGPHHGPHHGPRHGPHDGPHHGPHHGPRHGPHDGPHHGPRRQHKEKKDWIDKCHKKFLKKLNKKSDGECGQNMVLISEELLNFLCSAYDSNAATTATGGDSVEMQASGVSAAVSTNEKDTAEVIPEGANLLDISTDEENPAAEATVGATLAEDMSNLQVSKE